MYISDVHEYSPESTRFDDQFVGRRVIPTSGKLVGETADIVADNPGLFTITPMSEPMGEGDYFIIV